MIPYDSQFSQEVPTRNKSLAQLVEVFCVSDKRKIVMSSISADSRKTEWHGIGVWYDE